MRFVKKMLVAIFLLLICIFVRVWKIGYIVSDFLEVGSWIIFGAAILIVIDAVIEDFVKADKDKE